MAIATEAGYTWTDGKHSRMIHAGNAMRPNAITATEDSGSTADLVANDLTRDRWVPFTNALASPTDFSTTSWTLTSLAVAADGQTLTESGGGIGCLIDQDYTWIAEETIAAFKVTAITVPEVMIMVEDGTTTATCFFDLRDGTVGTASNCTGRIVDLGAGEYLVAVVWTPLAAAGTISLYTSNGSENISFVSTGNSMKVTEAAVHANAASIRLDSLAAAGRTCIAIGAHSLGSTGATITFQHDSNADDTFTDIGTYTPTDDSPIMFFFDSITSARWRVVIEGGVLSDVGVIKVSDPLKFERPFYSGFTPARMNRATDVLGNVSETGELLGRSIKRTFLAEQYQWQNLTYAWVRANLDAPGGVIQSVETAAAFLAWRPEETDDASYIMRAQTDAPRAMGMRDLWSFGMSGQVYSYE